MDYSPFNPVVWMLFFGGLALVYLCVSVYHRIYPYYPGEEKMVKEPSKASINMSAPTNLPKHREGM